MRPLSFIVSKGCLRFTRSGTDEIQFGLRHQTGVAVRTRPLHTHIVAEGTLCLANAENRNGNLVTSPERDPLHENFLGKVENPNWC